MDEYIANGQVMVLTADLMDGYVVLDVPKTHGVHMYIATCLHGTHRHRHIYTCPSSHLHVANFVLG